MSFAVVAVAGLAATAVGAGVSAYGASQNAKAVGKANASNADNEEMLFERQSENLDTLIRRKNKKLHNLGNIFDRFDSTGAFGETGTLKNLRKAQEDFSQLAAGDFTAFEEQVKKSMSDALINTVGAGSPVGAFAQLAADTQMQYRKEGIGTAMSISDYLSNESMKLLGAEFGIMDQRFDNQYNLDRTRVSNIANYRLGEAATEGIGMTAFGNAAMQVGSSMTSYGMNMQTMDMQNEYLKQAQKSGNSMTASANRPMSSFNPSSLPSYPTAGTPKAPVGGFDLNPIIPAYPTMNTYNPSAPSNSFISPDSPYGRRLNSLYGDPSVLPPLTQNSGILSQVGANIVRI